MRTLPPLWRQSWPVDIAASAAPNKLFCRVGHKYGVCRSWAAPRPGRVVVRARTASLTVTKSPGLDTLPARARRAMRGWILVGYPGQGGALAPHRVSPVSWRTPFTYTERGVNPRNWSAWPNSPGAVCRVKENRYLTQPP